MTKMARGRIILKKGLELLIKLTKESVMVKDKRERKVGRVDMHRKSSNEI